MEYNSPYFRPTPAIIPPAKGTGKRPILGPNAIMPLKTGKILVNEGHSISTETGHAQSQSVTGIS